MQVGVISYIQKGDFQSGVACGKAKFSGMTSVAYYYNSFIAPTIKEMGV